MTTSLAENAPATGNPPQAGVACDLCGSRRHTELAAASPARCRIVVCEQCGLMFAAPPLAPAELEGLYDSAFTGDAGSNVFTEQQEHRAQKVRSEEKTAGRWGFGVVESVLDPAGKDILDLRSRTGALAGLMAGRGAHVTCIDPFEANLAYARDQRGIEDVRRLRFSVFHQLEGIGDRHFDAVTALTQHLLSHVLSPRMLLQRIHDVLRPGGYLMLHEKDVLQPGKLRSASVFDTGKAHQFHLTRDTIELLARVAGFDILRCDDQTDRFSVSRHVLLVAQRPHEDRAAPSPDELLADWQGTGAIRQRVQRISRQWWLYRLRADARRLLRKLRRHIAGA